MNLKMPELKLALDKAGLEAVRTLLSSGNVVFQTRRASEATLTRRVEDAIEAHVGTRFLSILRPIAELQELLDADPYSAFRLPANSKRVVTFLRSPGRHGLELPIEFGGARIWRSQSRELLSSYVPSPKGPVFMSLIEKTFGKELTTRTWETVQKVVRAGSE